MIRTFFNIIIGAVLEVLISITIGLSLLMGLAYLNSF